MKELSNEEKKVRLEKYLGLYGNKYPGRIETYIRRLINEVPYSDVMRQIYYALDFFEEHDNPYIHFANLIENKFSIEQNICEVGCGCYPALAIELAKRQKKGSITAIDPYLVFTEKEKLKLIRDSFLNYDLSNIDLFIGMAPCNATIDLIDTSFDNQSNLILSPCDCAHFPKWYEPGLDYVNEWYTYVYDYMKQRINQGTIEIDYLKNETNYEYPIYTYKK